MPQSQDTNAKALRLNLDPLVYGAFAEIGGGQEVSRWFFRVGGASGTVAKTISAYDRTVSEALYGQATRAVSRERLVEMLDHEHGLMCRQLAPDRGARTSFFTFADTVATRSHGGGNECHGWLGVRFQTSPGSPTSDLVVHANLRDSTATQQQQSLGILGVNLLHAAIFERPKPREMLRSLMDGLTLDNIEVDVVEHAGPAWPEPQDPGRTAVDLLDLGLARALVFDDRGRMNQPSFLFYKRSLVVHRCSIDRDNPFIQRMVVAGGSMLTSEIQGMPNPPLPLFELSLDAALRDERPDPSHAAARIGELVGLGHATMVTRWPETYELTRYIRRYSAEPLRFVVGLDAVVQMLRHHFYNRVDGGLLEGLGRLLAPNVRVYVFPMSAKVFRERLALYETDDDFCIVPDKPMITLEDLSVPSPAGRLLEYLRDTGWLVSGKYDEPPTGG